jgi:hypothetical protein
MEQQHEMVLEMTHASGMQGWYCPTCGRRILLIVPPNSDMVIVDPGDKYAGHSGSIGGLRVGTNRISELKKEAEEISEDRLIPWIKALEKLNLNW